MPGLQFITTSTYRRAALFRPDTSGLTSSTNF
jgi:hypothetical protein